ncbi:MAG: hypothetical protein RLZ83_204 [Pseudomonadota bacterium]|jgi:hypothetical protein
MWAADPTRQAQGITHAPTPPCRQCRYLAISHDPARPYWCRRIGIKTRGLPGLEVWRADGRDCQGFEARQALAQ